MAEAAHRLEHPPKSGIVITEKHTASGRTGYRIDISGKRTGGKREQKVFSSLALAKDYARQRWEEIQHYGRAAFLLSAEQRLSAVVAFRRLDEVGLSLTEAVEIALRQYPNGRRLTLEQLRERFLTSPGRRLGKLVKRRHRTLETLKARTAVVVKQLGADRHADEITPQDFGGWLEQQGGWSPLTRNSYRLAAHAMFGYAHHHGHISKNPISQVPCYAITPSPPAILTVEQARRLLDAAAQTDDRLDLLGYVVLGLFAGLRRAELERLTWKAIKWDRRMITVDAHAAKMASIRNVPLPDNALDWLQICDFTERPLSPKGFRRRFNNLRRIAGISEWSGNELRHSFASYHYDHHQNAALTAASLGHTSGTNLLFAHYRSLVPLGEGARYFSLLPDLGESGEAPSALPTGTVGEDDLKVS